MDILTDAVMAMRTGRPHSVRHDLRAPWGMRFPSSAGGGFHIVLRGSCWLVGGESPIALTVGDVVFVRGNTAHALADSLSTPDVAFTIGAPGKHSGAVNPETVLLCGAYMLDETRAHPMLAELPPILHLPAHLGRNASLRAVVELLGGELEQPQSGTGVTVPALLDMLLMLILRAWLEQEPRRDRATGWVQAMNDPEIARALTAIHDDPAHPWTVEELGAEVGLSRAAFARKFTSLTGRPPLTYLTWWRMTIATRLLREGDLPLRVVAERAGYSSEVAFAMAFKRRFGRTPKQYQRGARGAEVE